MNTIPIMEALALDCLTEAISALQIAAHTDAQQTEVALLRSRYSQWERQLHSGMRTDAELDRDRNRLKAAVVYLLDKYQWRGLSANVVVPSTPVLSPTTAAQAAAGMASGGAASHSPKGAKTILFLGVQPKGTRAIRIDEEVRNLRERLSSAQLRDTFVLVDRYAVRFEDLTKLLQTEKPAIVHFSGHGYPDEGLVLEDQSGRVRVLDTALLTDVFKIMAQLFAIECVVLNACYSAQQAQAIAPYVGAVIGMSDALPDQSAIAFTHGFYDALGAGNPYPIAYEMGKLQVRGAGLQGEEMIELLVQNA